MTDAIQKAREALEAARETLEKVSRLFTEEHQLVLGGKRWGEGTLNNIDAALAALDAETEVKVLDDDQIMEVIKECAPWKSEPQLNDLLTYEKSPPMFPQATYDVPSYRAVNLVRAIERRIRSALVTPEERS